ncbi:MAG: hypothetical protein ACI9WU_002307 [Myxococcota bacterium]|jgi:hypothetical protein
MAKMITSVCLLVALTLSTSCSSRFTETPRDSRCFTDSDCGIGFSCDPFLRRCINNGGSSTAPDAGLSPSDFDATTWDAGPRNSPDITQAPFDTGATPTCSEGAVCDDDDPCTADDACDAEGVCAGAAYSCDDGFDCTLDACDGTGGCGYVVAALSCLIDGVCVEAGEPEPGNDCRGCLPSVALHAWTNDDTSPCEDGDGCTVGDTCKAGACVGGPAPSCEDDDQCTVDACPDAGGCANMPIVCDDEDACTTDTCDPGAGCVHTTISCDDEDACTTDSCDDHLGCIQTPIPNCP